MGPRAQQEVDSGVGHQVGVELSNMHVQRTVVSEGSGQRAEHLPDQPAEVALRG